MPELAEVALYAHDLNTIARDRKVSGVSFLNQGDWGRKIIPAGAQARLKRTVDRQIFFRSYGKGLFLYVTGDDQPLLEFRLGMTGQFHLDRKPDKWKRHYFLSLQLGGTQVFYADPRRFGRVAAPGETAFALGGYSEEAGFWRARKPCLPQGYLTQSRISWLLGTGELTGVGNYMANETLGRLKLSPFEPCRDRREALSLLRKSALIACDSYRRGGNSFGSGYFRLDGTEGEYLRYCRFYQNPEVPRVMFRGRPVFSHFAEA